MPDLPRIFAQPNTAYQSNVPQTTPRDFGAGVFRELEDITKNYVEQKSPLDVARAHDELKLKIDQYKTEATGEPDVLQREANFRTKVRQAQSEILSRYPDARTQQAARVLQENDITSGIISVRAEGLRTGIEQNLAYKDKKRDELAVAVGQSANPADQAKARNEYFAITSALATGARPSVEPHKIPEEMEKFDSLATQENAVFRAGRGEGYKVLADVYSGKYDYLPLADREKMKNLVSGVLADHERLDKIRKENEKIVHDQNLITDTVAAVSGAMTLPQLEAKAKVERYTPEEFNTVRRAMEEGGVTNPNIAIGLETRIRTNQLTDYTEISLNPNLDRKDKSRLMGLVSELKDDKHFSKTPEYQEAIKEVRAAISPKGMMESFDKQEQARNLFAMQELWNRVGKGESPMTVSRDIQARIAREPTQGEKPLFHSRFQSEDDLISAFKNKRISRETFDTEANLLKGWQLYNKQTATDAAKPPAAGSSSQRRR